jgi:hypothetical protein
MARLDQEQAVAAQEMADIGPPAIGMTEAGLRRIS